MEGFDQVVLHFREEDKRVLDPESSQLSLTMRYCQRKCGNLFKPHDLLINFPHKRIWDPSIPIKVALFALRAYFGRVQTMDKLNLKGKNNLDERSFRKENEE